MVIAKVAMDQLESLIKFSKSKLHAVTAAGWVMDTWFNVRTAEKRNVALGLEQKS